MTEPPTDYGNVNRQRQADLRETLSSGVEPPVPPSADALEREALSSMGGDARAFVSSGAGRNETTRANTAAFERWRIRPKVLRNVEERSLATRLFDLDLPAPLLLAPIGRQRVVDDEGELATARAATALGLPMVLSSSASVRLEDVASECTGRAPWFQLYVSANPDVTRSLIDRAEASGFRAVVVTVDTPVRGWRPTEFEGGFSTRGSTAHANYVSDPAFRNALDESPEDDPETAAEYYRTIKFKASLDWDDVEMVREATDLPLVLKGILDPEDAERAIERGADGIVVSNHGGNHLDGAIAALDALPAVVGRVDGRIPILFDSGIRTGVDAFKALALGADAVCIGRPYIYGLAIAGEAGIRAVVENVLAELDVTMANAGHSNVRDVGPDDVVETPLSTR